MSENADAIDDLLAINDPRAVELSQAINHEAEAKLRLLTRLPLGGEHAFAFFEPVPGVLLMLEEGAHGEQANAMSDDLEELSISEIYARLSPGTEVPAELLEAEARQTHGRLESSGTEVDFTVGGGAAKESIEALGEGIARSSSGLTAAQFTAGGNCPNGDYDFCLLNWANGAYAYSYSHRARFNLAPVSGSVLFELSVGGSNVGVWSALPGGYYYWTWHLGHTQVCYPLPLPPFVYCETYNDQATIRGDVTHASGNVFHFGGAFWD